MKLKFRITVLHVLIAVFVVFPLLSLAYALTEQANGKIARTAQPAVVVDVLDPSLEGFAPAWHDEISRRFPINTVGVLCHGGEFIDGEWIALESRMPEHLIRVTDLVAKEQAKFPGRTIVLLCCNPGHIELHASNVFYAQSSVWCVPDRATGDDPVSNHMKLGFEFVSQTRWQADPDVVGNIFEFVEAH